MSKSMIGWTEEDQNELDDLHAFFVSEGDILPCFGCEAGDDGAHDCGR